MINRQKAVKDGLRAEEGLTVVKDAGYTAKNRDKNDGGINKRAGLNDKKTRIGEGEKRIYRRKPLALKHKRRLRKTALAFSVMFALALASVGFGFLMVPEVPDIVDYGYKTVYYELPSGGEPTDHTALEAVGYMHYRFKQRRYWYSEFESTVNAVALGIPAQQKVYTYKQYKDDVLVSADITTGLEIVCSARQFCTAAGRVLWRSAAGNSSTYNGMDTEWKNSLDGNLPIEGEGGFKEKRGYPPTEFSVYVINEKTVLPDGTSEKVVDNGDGTYSVELHLNGDYDTENLGANSAVYYYGKQMATTGGLSGLPKFDDIKVKYTFDADWTVLRCEIQDAYFAKVAGLDSNCSSTSVTVYSYEKEKCDNTYYEDFFKPLLGEQVSPEEENKINAFNCIMNAFGGVMVDGAVFKLNASLGAMPLNGVVDLKMNNGALSGLSFKLGDITAHLDKENGKQYVYLSLGGAKYKLCTDDLNFGGGAGMSAAEGTGLDINALLSQLADDNAFSLSEDGKSAVLSPVLDLFGLKIPLEFNFLIDGDKVTLGDVNTALSLGETPLKAKIEFGTQADAPALLTEADKAAYSDMMNEGLALNVALGIDGFGMDGTVYIGLEGGSFGGIRAGFGGLNVVYDGDALYLDLGKNARYKVATGKVSLPGFDFGAIDSEDIKSLLGKLVGGIKTDENGITVSTDLNVFETVLNLAVTLKLNDGFGLNVNLNAFDKEISVAVGFGNKADAPAELTAEDKRQYADLMNDGVTLAVGLNIDGVEFDGNVHIALEGGKFVGVRANIAGIDFIFSGKELYLDCGGNAKYMLSLPSSAAFADGNAETSIAELIGKLLDITDFTENGITVETQFEVLGALVNLAANVNINGGIGIDAELALFGKHISASVAFGDKSQIPAAPTEEDKKDYIYLNEGFSLSGTINLNIDDTEIKADVKNLALSFVNGIEFALDATLTIGDTYNDFYVSYAGGTLVIAYGDVGFTVDTMEGLQTIGEAFVETYNRIAAVVNEIAGENKLVQAESFDDILKLLKTGGTASFDLAEILKILNITTDGDGNIDIAELIKSVQISAENGKLNIALGNNFAFSIGSDLTAGGSLNLEIGSAAVGIKLENARISHYVLPVCPVEEGKLVNSAQIAEMLGYLGSAAEMLVEQSVTARVSGQLSDGSSKYAQNGFVKYDFEALLEYDRGENGFPIHFNGGEDLNFYIDSTAYVHFNLQLTARNSADESLYLDFYLLDATPNRTENGLTAGGYHTDGILDVYLSVSKLLPSQAGYEPLYVYAPADELMTLVSMAVAMLNLDDVTVGSDGIDKELSDKVNGVIAEIAAGLNTLLVDKYIPFTKDQFASLGDSFIPQLLGGNSISSILNSLLENAMHMFDGETDSDGEVVVTEGNFIKDITVLENSFSVTLDSAAMNGTNENADDLTFTVSKTVSDGRTRISGISFENIVFGDNTENKLNLALGLDYQKVSKPAAELGLQGYRNFDDLDTLLKTFVNSATHKATEEEIAAGATAEYLLNREYFIDGSVKLKLHLGSLKLMEPVINVALGINIADDNSVAVNVKLNYDKVSLVITEAAQVDMTIVGDMIYMRKTSGGKVTYRVMTLSDFSADIFKQLEYMFNFSSLVMSFMKSDGNASMPEAKDYGAMLSNYISLYEYDSSADVWTVKINGKTVGGLIGVSMDDITVRLNAEHRNDGTYILKSLSIDGEMMGIINLSGTLVYENPQNIWADGKSNTTINVATTALGELGGRSWEEVLGGFTYDEICARTHYEQLLRDANTRYIAFGNGSDLKVGTLAFEYAADGYNSVFEEHGTRQTVIYNSAARRIYTVVEAPEPSSVMSPIDGRTAVWQPEYIADENGNLIYRAIYDNTYSVTIFSDYRTDDNYVWDENSGLWLRTVENAYKQVLVRKDLVVAAEENGETVYYGLKGYTYADGGACEFTDSDVNADGVECFVLHVNSDTELRAVWERVYKVTFGDIEKFYYADTVLTADNMPAVPEKTGHTGTWYTPYGEIAENTVISADGEYAFVAVYTINTYTVTVVSSQNVVGSEWSDAYNGYVTVKEYEYFTNVDLNDVSGAIISTAYNFGGYYENAEFSGEPVADTVVRGDVVYYAQWVGKIIEVDYRSDVAYENCKIVSDGLYGDSVRLRFGQEEELAKFASSDGLFLGWFIQEGEGYRFVESGAALKEMLENYGIEGESTTATLWAAWAKDLVTINLDRVSGTQWKYEGSYSLGFAEGISETLAVSAGVSANVSVTYYAHGKAGLFGGYKEFSYDNLGNAMFSGLSGSLSKGGMNCGNGTAGAKNLRGSVTVSAVFTFGGAELARTSEFEQFCNYG